MSKVDSLALYRTRRILSELSMKKGRGTELVSVYIPPKKAIHEVISSLREEYGTAANIKSDSTRAHVQDALVKTMQRLKLYPRTPQNGLVIFAGALPTDGPGSETVFIYEVIPPKPIQIYLYRCDDHFHLEPLKEMLKEEKVIGIISIDATEAGLGIVAGSRFEVVDVVTSGVGGKHRAGGQSARRFERLREMELTNYYNRVARHAKRVFLEGLEGQGIQGLIVSGPGPTKEEFLKGEFLDYRLQNSIIAVLDTSYAGSEGVRETVAKSEEVLQDIRLIEEKKLVQRFLKEVNSTSGLASYGINDVIEALRNGRAETVIVSDDIDMVYIKMLCQSCGNAVEKLIPRPNYVGEKQSLISEVCKNCSSNRYELLEKDVVEYLADLAAESGAKVEVISSKTEEGMMLKSFGGVAALLRYQ